MNAQLKNTLSFRFTFWSHIPIQWIKCLGQIGKYNLYYSHFSEDKSVIQHSIKFMIG